MAKENEEKIEIWHNRTIYGNDQKWINNTKTDEFIYPIVYSTGKERRLQYSSKKDDYIFNKKKVILGKASPENGFYDKGEYGVSNHCFAIVVKDD